jgi:acetylornithine deacetylase/succinyl-diaminopimelate desuccinylase-like protein
MTYSPISNIDEEVAQLVSNLIQIDSTNFGDDSGPGEAAVAEYVEDLLKEVGYQPERFQTSSSKRQGVYLRIPGEDPSLPALLAHGHLDVVPAVGDWTHAPFSGEIHDGMVWGRGAVDMKDGNGILLSVVRAWKKHGIKPRRDLVMLFLPDEEAGGRHGAHWLVDNRPEFFQGVSEAVGEVGGFSFQVNRDLNLYFIQTAEKGIRWMQLIAEGKAGHGAMHNDVNAVTELAETVSRIGKHRFERRLTKTNIALVKAISEAFNLDIDPEDVESLVKVLGPTARTIGASFSNTAKPTMLNAGYKVNVVPGDASAMIDARVLPGFEAEFDKEFNQLLGEKVKRRDVISDIALETEFEGPLVDLMAASLTAEDKNARTVPYLLSGGTDAKAFARLGIRCYGFIPLQLPPDLDFAALFHGVDERVPISSLKFGTRVMERFLRQA